MDLANTLSALALLVPVARAGAADVLTFDEPDSWWLTVGPTQTIDFTEFPWGTLVTDHYQGTHGVQFTDGSDMIVGCSVNCSDGSILNGTGSIDVEFDRLQSWIAVDYNGRMQIELFADDQLVYDSARWRSRATATPDDGGFHAILRSLGVFLRASVPPW